jgi:hypothetical protein
MGIAAAAMKKKPSKKLPAVKTPAKVEERPLTAYEAALHNYMTKTCGAVNPVRL